MSKIILILGGARSGKSTQAVSLAKKLGKKIAFIATGFASDPEMKKRIKKHKQGRPSWPIFEAKDSLSSILAKLNSCFEVVIIDCLTLFVSGLLCRGLKAIAIEKEVNRAFQKIKSAGFKAVVVSNEVGLGLVPENKLGREFRDLAGRINQLAASQADQVLFMVSGLPLELKGR